jgi:predicted NBD/HSP70 family sugar kinase
MTSSSGATQDEIRRRNVSTLLRHVHVHGARSRAQLTELMGLNRSTIKALVDELTDAGLVAERIPDTGLRAGRPSHVVVPRADTAYVLAANIGIDTVTAAAVGVGGALLARREYPLAGLGAKPDVVTRRLATELRKLQGKVPPTAWLAGVGVGVPGVVRRRDGRVEFAPNLMWQGVPFGQLLADRLAVTASVRVGNDGDLGALAEHARGAGRGIEHLIYLAAEVGIGGGIIIDGRTVVGAQGYAGEFGHMIVNPQGRRCRCGGQGCFEAEVGEEAVLLACGRDPSGGKAAMAELIAAAHRGEPHALRGLREIAPWVAFGLTNLVNIFNPDLIILGGPLSELFFMMGEEIRTQVDALTRFAGRRSVCLVPPGLGPDSSLFGAAELAFEDLLSDPIDARDRLVG